MVGKALIVWGTDTALVWLEAVSNAGWWWLGASLTARDEREAHCQPIAGGCRDRGSQLVGVIRGGAGVVSGRLNKRCVFWCCFNGREGGAVGSAVGTWVGSAVGAGASIGVGTAVGLGEDLVSAGGVVEGEGHERVFGGPRLIVP